MFDTSTRMVNGKWIAIAHINGMDTRINSYETEDEAQKAADKYLRQQMGADYHRPILSERDTMVEMSTVEIKDDQLVSEQKNRSFVHSNSGNLPKLTKHSDGNKRKWRKNRWLPIDWMLDLHAEGYSAKAIATRLKREQGINVSYKTVERVLSGQRKCSVVV